MVENFVGKRQLNQAIRLWDNRSLQRRLEDSNKRKREWGKHLRWRVLAGVSLLRERGPVQLHRVRPLEQRILSTMNATSPLPAADFAMSFFTKMGQMFYLM